MRIVIGIGHPKQVHFWKNIIMNLLAVGHELKIVAWDKDITLYLLDAYGLEYETVGKNYAGMLKKAYGMLTSELRLLTIVNEFKPDILLGGAPYLAHVSRLVRKPHISFTDTEHANVSNSLSIPFTDIVFTPSCYKGIIDSKKHMKYNGYMELAYLHPNYFKPDSSVLDDMGLSNHDKFIIMRLVSWGASHDMHSKGFSNLFLEETIKKLEKYGNVYISSEEQLDIKFRKHEIPFPPEKLHSALYYSDLYIGDGGSTAVEAAILGTPSIHLVSVKLASGEIIGASQIHGNFDELVNKYGILYSYVDQKQALDKALDILQSENIKKELCMKRKKMFEDKIDVTSFLTDFIEKYPQNYNSSNSE